jgi:hypothetical protein
MKKLCIDVGFGDTKVAEMIDGVITKYFKETNAVAKLVGESDTVKYTGTEKDVIKYRDSFYLVGKNALQYPDKAVLNVLDYDSMAFITPLIALKYINTNTDPYDSIIFTLSSAFIKRSSEYRDHLIAELGMDKSRIKIIPQGAGAKVTLDNIGLDLSNPSAKNSYKNYLIVDIGFNTVDVANVIGNSIMPADIKGYPDEGVINIAKYVQKKLAEVAETEISISRARSVLYDKTLKVRDKVHDCSSMISEGISEYLNHLKVFLENNYGDLMDTIDNVILFGGGAELIKDNSDQWKSLYGEGFMLSPKLDAEYYNCIGGLYI